MPFEIAQLCLCFKLNPVQLQGGLIVPINRAPPLILPLWSDNGYYVNF